MEYPLDNKIKTLFLDKGYDERTIGRKLGISEDTVVQILSRLGIYSDWY